MLASPRSRAVAALGSAAMLALTAGCGTVQVPAGPDAADPLCAELVIGAPSELLGLDRSETSSQGTVAWGSGEETVVLRCGVQPPGPTTERCTRLGEEGGVTVDWIVREQDDVVFFTTYGRSPAIELSIPGAVDGDQPSAAALDLTPLVDRLVPATDQCVGTDDVS